MSNNNELGFTFFDESSDMVETTFNKVRLVLFNFLFVSFFFGFVSQSSFFFGSAFWFVFVQKFEKILGFVSRKGVRELVDGSRDFQSFVENSSLSL